MTACSGKKNKDITENKSQKDSVKVIKLIKKNPDVKIMKIKGIDNYITINNDDNLQSAMDQPEKWFLYNVNDSIKGFVMFFEKNPIGVKHTLTKVVELCNMNGRNFKNPDIDDSLIPFFANSIFDYEAIYLGLSQKDCEIKKFWDIGKGRLGIIMSSEFYSIVFYTQRQN